MLCFTERHSRCGNKIDVLHYRSDHYRGTDSFSFSLNNGYAKLLMLLFSDLLLIQGKYIHNLPALTTNDLNAPNWLKYKLSHEAASAVVTQKYSY